MKSESQSAFRWWKVKEKWQYYAAKTRYKRRSAYQRERRTVVEDLNGLRMEEVGEWAERPKQGRLRLGGRQRLCRQLEAGSVSGR